MDKKNIDIILKVGIEKGSDVPSFLNWNKEKSWNILSQKRKKRILLISIKYAAIFLIGISIFSIFYFVTYDSHQRSFQNDHIHLSEYEKRLKLLEIEEKLSGNYFQNIICENCDGIIYKTVESELQINPFIF